MNINSRYKSYFYIDTPKGRMSVLPLFWPMMLENVMKYLITTVNTLILSRYSDNSVAAVGVSGQVINLIVGTYTALGIGTLVVLSQSLGSGNKENTCNLSTIAVAITAVFSFAMMIIIFCFNEQLLQMMQLESGLMQDGRSYLVIVAAFTVFEALITVLSSIARCYGHTKVPMIVITVMNILNAVGCYMVIMRPIEIPFHGVSGVAMARGTSVLISFGVMLFIIRNIPIKLGWRAFRKENQPIKNMKAILRISIPSGLSNFSYMFSQTVATAILAQVGASAVTTMVYINNIVQYIKAFSLALSHSYQILIGWLVGMGDRAKAMKLGNISIFLCAVTNTVLAIGLCFIRYSVLGIFTDSVEIINLAANVMIINILVELFRAMNHGGGGNLVATGDVKYFVSVSISSCWLFSIGFSFVFGVLLNMGIYGCWLAFCLDEAFRAISYFCRWRSGKWEKYALAEPQEP